jgi:hypothetical protein
MQLVLTQGEAERKHNPQQAHARKVIGHLGVQTVSLALQKNKTLFVTHQLVTCSRATYIALGKCIKHRNVYTNTRQQNNL